MSPLAEARRVCDGAIRRGARSMLGDVPASDLAQLELLLAQLGTRQRMREHSQALLLEAQRSLKGAETASEAELELCDRLDEIKLAMARAQRHHDDGELARLRTEAAELHEALASVRSQAEHARRVLADPLLLEEYPEMRRHVRERAQAGGGSGGGFEGGGFEGGGFEGSVFGIAGLGAYGDGGSGVVGVGSLVDSMLRFAAFELLTEASRHQPGRLVWRAAAPSGGEVLLSALEQPKARKFEMMQERLKWQAETARRCGGGEPPHLTLPQSLFYEPEQPATTYVVSPAEGHAEGTASLGAWIRAVRGNPAALLAPAAAAAAPAAPAAAVPQVSAVTASTLACRAGPDPLRAHPLARRLWHGPRRAHAGVGADAS